MSKLGQLLVARGWINVQQLTRALKNQNVVGGRLGTCLLEMDALSEDLLLKGLAEQLGVPAAGVDDLHGIPEEVRDLLSAKLARRCRAIPFRALGGRLDVAMLDARNLACQDEIAFATGKRVKVHIGAEIRIFEALEKYYDEECPSRFTNLLDRLNRSRYLWAREPRAQESLAAAGAGGAVETDPFVRPRSFTPSPLPEPASPPTPQRISAPLPPPAAARAVAAVEPPPPAPLIPLTPKPRPAPPPPVRSIALTPEERAAIGPSNPASLDEVMQAFEAVHDREEVGRILLAFLVRSYRRAALFQAGREKVSGWMAAGEGVDPEAFARFAVRFDQPSLFLNLRQGSGFHLGPLAPMPAHRELARAWGGELPRDCVLLPVRIKDRLVAFIYADRAEGGSGGLHLEELKRLADAAVAAFERCILYKKKTGTAL
ncbi:MAG TPA: hypothetical protein VOA87_21360 [Thermoanaerobaculia bacterium]|nr:hypothetical protein [Thermoanaerobaculia bacterium]